MALLRLEAVVFLCDLAKKGLLIPHSVCHTDGEQDKRLSHPAPPMELPSSRDLRRLASIGKTVALFSKPILIQLCRAGS